MHDQRFRSPAAQKRCRTAAVLFCPPVEIRLKTFLVAKLTRFRQHQFTQLTRIFYRSGSPPVNGSRLPPRPCSASINLSRILSLLSFKEILPAHSALRLRWRCLLRGRRACPGGAIWRSESHFAAPMVSSPQPFTKLRNLNKVRPHLAFRWSWVITRGKRNGPEAFVAGMYTQAHCSTLWAPILLSSLALMHIDTNQ